MTLRRSHAETRWPDKAVLHTSWSFLIPHKLNTSKEKKHTTVTLSMCTFPFPKTKFLGKSCLLRSFLLNVPGSTTHWNTSFIDIKLTTKDMAVAETRLSRHTANTHPVWCVSLQIYAKSVLDDKKTLFALNPTSVRPLGNTSGVVCEILSICRLHWFPRASTDALRVNFSALSWMC